MFEAFAIRVLEACSSVKQAAALLGLDWDTVQGIMKRAVDRGLERREMEQITQLVSTRSHSFEGTTTCQS
jgi:transposase